MIRDFALHAGVLVPWANSVVEAELPRWAGTSVIWFQLGACSFLPPESLQPIASNVKIATAQLVTFMFSPPPVCALLIQGSREDPPSARHDACSVASRRSDDLGKQAPRRAACWCS